MKRGWCASVKRDMELVRAMLLFVEGQERRGDQTVQPIAMPGWSIEELAYHRDLLIDAGYLEATSMEIADFDSSEVFVTVTGLTWQGHDLLDLMRDERSWRRALLEKPEVRNMPLEVVKAVLTSVVTRLMTGGA